MPRPSCCQRAHEDEEEEEEEQEHGQESDVKDSNNEENDEYKFDQNVSQLLQYIDWNVPSEIFDNIDSADRTSNNDFKQWILSKRYQLNNKHCVLRSSYKGYALHAFRTSVFERQPLEYVQQMHIYKIIGKINTSRPLLSQEYLLKVIKQVQTTVDDLFCSHGITQRQYDQMCISRSEVELNYLVFVLDAKKVFRVLLSSFYDSVTAYHQHR